ncbi:hypothetical protein KSX_56920 [Ktedonospora formicarum]|uniref:Uncharacterized protein n=1 Tax=Ktedonospora formicarum TaxID=2778364 RepID=A0A8J3IA60_9CHLR|nr:hypothetical protein KSX_56920 [Ktedonospora formicarum]
MRGRSQRGASTEREAFFVGKKRRRGIEQKARKAEQEEARERGKEPECTCPGLDDAIN